jgi:hypothetical protein
VRIDLALLALDLMYLAAGYALLYATGIVRLRPGDVRFVGLAFLAGWALMGTVLSLLLMAGVGLYIATVPIAAAVVAAACVGVGRWRPNLVPQGISHARSVPAAAVATVAGIVIVVAGAAAVLTALGSQWNPEFDLLSAWLPRAQIVYYLHQLNPGQWSSFIDPWYPPLVPVMFGATWQYAGGFHPSVLPIQQVVLGLSFVLASLALLDRFVPRWLSFPSLALLIVTPWFWWRLQSLMPDATLAYLLAAAAIVCVIWLYEPNGAWLVLGVVFLAAATLAKLEGLVFSLLLVGVVVAAGVVLRRRRALPALLLLLGPAVTIPWRLWLSAHDVMTSNPDFQEPRLTNPSFLWSKVGAFFHSLGLILGGPWRPAYRTTEIILVIGALVAIGVVRRIPVLATATVVWLGLMAVALAGTYAATRVSSTDSYIGFTASRVGGAFIVAAATLAPLLLGLALRRESRR